MAAAENETAAAQPAVSKCQVCGEAAAKYCCPRCDRRTCSLQCVKGEHRLRRLPAAFREQPAPCHCLFADVPFILSRSAFSSTA